MIANLKIKSQGFDTAKDGTCKYNVSFTVNFNDSSIGIVQSQWNFIVFGKDNTNTQRIDMQEKTLTGNYMNEVLEFSLRSFQFDTAASQCFNFTHICIEFGETFGFLVTDAIERKTPYECDEIGNNVPCARLGKL